MHRLHCAAWLSIVALSGCSSEGPPAGGSSGSAVTVPASAAGRTASSSVAAPEPSGASASAAPSSSTETEIAATSADGKMRAYVKPSPEPSIWTSTVDGQHSHRELELNADPELATAASLGDLAFSADRKRLYFRSFSSASTTPLWSLELGAAKVTKFAHHAESYRVVQKCKDKKLEDTVLVLEERQLFEGVHLPTIWYWLYSSDKRALGPVGPDEANVQRFFAKACGEGEPPPDPPEVERPKELQKLPLECAGSTIVGRSIRLLDGTSVEQLAIRDGSVPAKDAVPVGITPERALAFVAKRCPAK